MEGSSHVHIMSETSWSYVSYCLGSVAALRPGVRRHHRHPAHPCRAALHRRQQRGQKPAHLHHLLRVRTQHIASDEYRHQVNRVMR